jgi:hypothetical protein
MCGPKHDRLVVTLLFVSSEHPIEDTQSPAVVFVNAIGIATMMDSVLERERVRECV